MQFPEAIAVLDNMLEDIHQEHARRTADCTQADFHGRWTGDEVFKANLENLKRCSERISHACTKFTLVNLHQSDSSTISTLLAEFLPYINDFYEFYKYVSMNTLCERVLICEIRASLTSSLGWPLYTSLEQLTRSLIAHVSSLFTLAWERNTDSMSKYFILVYISRLSYSFLVPRGWCGRSTDKFKSCLLRIKRPTEGP